MKTLWKSMKAGLTSANGKIDWKIGEWQTAEIPLDMCKNGFHASKNVIDAMGYVPAEIIARVEVDGAHEEQEDKQCWEKMRIIEARIWEKADSVALAIFAAELVLENFERVFPEDKRPRLAIEAAKEWIRNPAENSAAAAARSAAASAAWSAESVAARAESAAWSAAWSAWSAAESAARSAESAAWSAAWSASAAESAACAAIKEKCSDFVLARIASKPHITEPIQ